VVGVYDSSENKFIDFEQLNSEQNESSRSFIKVNNTNEEETLSPLKISSFIEDPLFKLSGGSDELDTKEESFLIESIVSKSQQTEVEEQSINKIIQKILKFIEPVIFNQKLLAIIKQS
jgi:hypothetical protein